MDTLVNTFLWNGWKIPLLLLYAIETLYFNVQICMSNITHYIYTSNSNLIGF